MSTHSCFAPLFPFDTLLRSEVGAPEMEFAGDGYYTADGAYYYVEAAPDAQE